MSEQANLMMAPAKEKSTRAMLETHGGGNNPQPTFGEK